MSEELVVRKTSIIVCRDDCRKSPPRSKRIFGHQFAHPYNLPYEGRPILVEFDLSHGTREITRDILLACVLAIVYVLQCRHIKTESDNERRAKL